MDVMIQIKFLVNSQTFCRDRLQKHHPFGMLAFEYVDTLHRNCVYLDTIYQLSYKWDKFCRSSSKKYVLNKMPHGGQEVW